LASADAKVDAREVRPAARGRRWWISASALLVSCGVAALGITYPARIRPAPPAGIEALRPGFPGPPLARRAVVVVVDDVVDRIRLVVDRVV